MTATIDAHQHVWSSDLGRYPWLSDAPAELQRAFDFEEAQPLLDACGITGTVLVQAADNSDDTDHMIATAHRHTNVVAVVAWAPLDHPAEMAEHLDRLKAEPIVRGVRNLFHLRPREWSTSNEVLSSLSLLAEAGLTLDFVTGSHHAIADAVTLAKRTPNLSLVIDHLGKPPIGGSREEQDDWSDDLARAAELPSVFAKVSGLYPADISAEWRASDLRPFVHAALDAFGAERLMYGGDWPICRLTGGYKRWFAAMNALLDELSDSEQAAVRGGTAMNFYGVIDPQEREQ